MNTFNPEALSKIVCDDMSRLRVIDIFRLLEAAEEISNEAFSEMIGYIVDKRPDLEEDVIEASIEITS